MANFFFVFCFFFSVFFINSITFAENRQSDEDYLWLEEILGEPSVAFVTAQNSKTFQKLKEGANNAVFQENYQNALKDFQSEERIPSISFSDDEGGKKGRLFNFWQDKRNIRGLLRMTTVDSL